MGQPFDCSSELVLVALDRAGILSAQRLRHTIVITAVVRRCFPASIR